MKTKKTNTKKISTKLIKQSRKGLFRGIQDNIFQFRLGEALQKRVDNLTDLENQLSLQTKKLQKQHNLYETNLKSLKEFEGKLFDKHLNGQADKITSAILKGEIQKLMEVVKTQQEVISKSHFSTSEISELSKPQVATGRYPLDKLKSFITYKKNIGKYEEQIKNVNHTNYAHIILKKSDQGLEIETDGSKNYKSEYLKVADSSVAVSDNLKRIYYLADIPAFLSPYVFFKLLTSDLPFTINIFVEPATSAELLKKAKQRLSVLEMQQNERMRDGKVRDQQLDKNMEEVASFIDELVHESERGVVYSFYLELEANDRKELDNLHKKLQNIAGAMDLTFNTYIFGQKQAFKSMLPFNEDHVKENRIIQSTAASYLLPFVSKQLSDPEGIFMGVNAYNNSLVFLNPFTSRNNNINIFGVSGSGKSVTAKTLLYRLYLQGIQSVVIDPEREYVDLARKLGGEVIQFSRENGINPFYVQSSKENEILDHISTLKTFFKFFIPQHHYDGALLDKVLIKLYDSGVPNFDNLLELLKDNPMHQDLSVLSTGSLRGVFSSTRKLELNSDIIVLDLYDLKKDEKRDPAMYLLTSLIWNLFNKQTDRKRMLFIDEAHKLLVDDDVAVFYRELVKQARKRNVGVVSITQDVEDFLRKEYGKAIITNSETKILLKQAYATLGDIGTIYPMTEEEKGQLGHLGIGEMLLFREEEHIRLDMIVLPHEQPLVFPKSPQAEVEKEENNHEDR